MMIDFELPTGWTREQLLAVADREIRLRDQVYPRQVAMGRMGGAKALEEQAGMRAIRAVLAQLPTEEPTQAALFDKGAR